MFRLRAYLRFLLYFITFNYSTVTFGNITNNIIFETTEGVVSVNPYGLKLNFQNKNNNESIAIIDKNLELFSQPVSTLIIDKVHQIQYDNKIVVHLSAESKTLNIKIFPKHDIMIHWPNINENHYLRSYLIPEGEGLFVPCHDKKIRSVIQNTSLDHSNMIPFLGYIYDHFSVTLIIHTPFRNAVTFNEYAHGQSLKYDFRLRDKSPYYEISLTFSKPDLLESARIFKNFLKNQGKYSTFAEKISHNPEIMRLSGAIHAYVWGNGRTIAALEALHNIGIKKAWIGYEEKPHNLSNDKWNKSDYVDSKFIDFAKKLGYLVGAYDEYNTMQRSQDADCYYTDFGNEFYSTGCVRNKSGQIVKGFAGRGCAISMTALDELDNKPVYDRLKKFRNDGINSYFLDCHGMLEAHDDYSLEHPQTIFEDIAIRLKHLKYLSKQDLVIGSESSTAYTIPYLAYSHGNFSTLYSLHYRAAKDKKSYGGWGPTKRPAIFFKSIESTQQYAIRYAPEYRIPLFQSIFHESIVATDRWEVPLTKFTNLYQDRFLLEILYGVPSMWNLDLEHINKYKNILRYLAQEFTPLHENIMTETLEDFQYLSDDRKVQRTVFGDQKIIMIANFKDEIFEGIPAKSIKLINPIDKSTKIISPPPLK